MKMLQYGSVNNIPWLVQSLEAQVNMDFHIQAFDYKVDYRETKILLLYFQFLFFQ